MASFILPIISGLAGLFGGQKKQQEQTNTTTQQGNQQYTNVNNPILSGDQTRLMDNFINGVINKFNAGTPDLKGYEAGGLQQINDDSNLKSQVLKNMLASRGQSFSPAASYAQTLPESQRIDQGTQFINQMPLLQRQFQSENINDLIKAFQVLPTATESTGSSQSFGSSNQRGTQLLPGNPVAGALSGVGAGLAAPNGSGGNNLGDILSALGLGGGGGGNSTWNPKSPNYLP